MQLNNVKTFEDVKTFISNVIDQTVNVKMSQTFIDQIVNEAHIKGVIITTEDIKTSIETSVKIINSVLMDIFINNLKEQWFEKYLTINDPNYFNIVMIMKIKQLSISLLSMCRTASLLFPNDNKQQILTDLVDTAFYQNKLLFTLYRKFDIK